MAAAPETTGGLTVSNSPPDPLQRFCADLLAAVPPSAGETAVPFRGLREVLVRVLSEGARAVAADLRKEMVSWGTAVEHLERLSASPYLPDPEIVQRLRAHLERSCDQAARIAEVLEAAPCPSPSRAEPLPAVSEGGRTDPPQITAAPVAALPNYRQTADQPRQVSQTRDEAGTPPAAAVPAEKNGLARDAPIPARPRKMPAAAPSKRVEVRCPRCGGTGSVRWDRLDRVLSCRGCSRWYRVHSNGTLVEVVSMSNGRWIEKTARDAAARGQSLRRWGRWTLPLLALTLVMAAFFLLGRRTSSAAPEELPRELKPRVELFVQAWLARDIPRMKQLTAATRERAVYSWFKKNQPPRMPDGSEDGVKYGAIDIEVQQVPGGAKQARVKVHIREVVGASGKSDVRLTLLWEESGDAWYFVPPLR